MNSDANTTIMDSVVDSEGDITTRKKLLRELAMIPTLALSISDETVDD
jgi:hypothetical protein